jgi:predicted nucleic acid-binding protein
MKTYLDVGVLIFAFRADGDVGQRAMQILDDQNREFVSSVFAKLEILPKAIYHQNIQETQFYEVFFDSVQYWANDVEILVQDSYQISCEYGLAALDALHVAAALSLGAEELITTERRTKPMHRVSGIRVISILDN